MLFKRFVEGWNIREENKYRLILFSMAIYIIYLLLLFIAANDLA